MRLHGIYFPQGRILGPSALPQGVHRAQIIGSWQGRRVAVGGVLFACLGGDSEAQQPAFWFVISSLSKLRYSVELRVWSNSAANRRSPLGFFRQPTRRLYGCVVKANAHATLQASYRRGPGPEFRPWARLISVKFFTSAQVELPMRRSDGHLRILER